MSSATPTLQEPAEAVIISGPRKGEFITITSSGEVITAEDEELLEKAIAAAWQMAESAKEARMASQALRQEMRDSVRKIDELLRTHR